MSEWIAWMGFVTAGGGFAFTLFKWLVERRDRRAEQIKLRKLENDMQEIVRRGRAPFLRATNLHVPAMDGRPNQILRPGEKVERPLIPTGTTLSLTIANDGEVVRNMDDDWPSPEGFTVLPLLPCDPYHATDLNYRYDSALFGEPRRIKLTFETQDGLQLHQVYETKIGVCYLKRVDPA